MPLPRVGSRRRRATALAVGSSGNPPTVQTSRHTAPVTVLQMRHLSGSFSWLTAPSTTQAGLASCHPILPRPPKGTPNGVHPLECANQPLFWIAGLAAPCTSSMQAQASTTNSSVAHQICPSNTNPEIAGLAAPCTSSVQATQVSTASWSVASQFKCEPSSQAVCACVRYTTITGLCSWVGCPLKTTSEVQ